MTMPNGRSDALFHEREATSSADLMSADVEQLASQLRWVAPRSAFYREMWSPEQLASAERAQPEELPGLLASLPVTTKDDLRIAQEGAPPFGTHLACEPDEVALVHRTSGTTGRPLVIAATAEDIAVTSSRGGQAFWCAGLRQTDVAVHCLNYCMWAGGVTDHHCLEATGAAVVPFGVGNTAELRELPSWLPFSALSCTPSYISLLMDQLDDAERARWSEHLRIVLVGGEPGGSAPALRQRLDEVLGARLANANYGLAEVLSNFGSECEHGDGMHFHGQGAIWLELVDPESGALLPLEAGSRGSVILTHLCKRAQPLVRYETNDVMEIVSTDRCQCGRSSFRFRLHGRADDMFVVRGINVFPTAVERALSKVSTRITEFAVVLPDTPTFDRIPLRVEVDPTDATVSIAALEAVLKQELGCSVEIQLLAPGTLPRSSGKTRRVYRNGESPEATSE